MSEGHAFAGSKTDAPGLHDCSALSSLATVAGAQLWLIDLDASLSDRSASWVSPAELERSQRFAFQVDARRHLAAHTALRMLLWRHCDEPARSDIQRDPFGRPRLARADASSFNLSHSGNRALIGICRQAEVGVDIELLREVGDVWALAERVLSPAELDMLRRAPESEVSRSFLIAWTRKEACLKAVGRGLSIAPDSVEVGLSPTSRPLTLACADGAWAVDVHSLALDTGAVGAVALASALPPRFNGAP